MVFEANDPKQEERMADGWTIERKAQAMSKAGKVSYVHSRGWSKLRGNVWRRRFDGKELPCGAATRYQLEQDGAAG
jgi:hypothetical protein